MNDVIEFAKARPHVKFRHFFKPSHTLDWSLREIKFNNKTTWKYQEQGRNDANEAVEDSTKHSFTGALSDIKATI